MKILYVDLQYDYGIKKRGLNSISLDGFIKNIQLLGHEIKLFFYDKYLINKTGLQKDIISIANKYNPDLIFFQFFTNQFTINTLDYLKSKYKTIGSRTESVFLFFYLSLNLQDESPAGRTGVNKEADDAESHLPTTCRNDVTKQCLPEAV